MFYGEIVVEEKDGVKTVTQESRMDFWEPPIWVWTEPLEDEEKKDGA